jgi:TMEM175 potassium channel family protein
MDKTRLEAFSDGVLAVVITIMVLEMKVPHGSDLQALEPMLPVFLTYVLSFIYLGIYWNNHHHLLHASKRINAAVMWANMHLLFWLSLIPFATGWMGENHFASLPVATYGVAQFMPGVAYNILRACIVRANGTDKALADALGRDIKGKLSPLFCLAGIGLAFFSPLLACVAYVLLALMWLIPDRRIEKTVKNS